MWLAINWTASVLGNKKCASELLSLPYDDQPQAVVLTPARCEINARVMPCPEMMAPVSLIVIDCCGLSFSSTRKNYITPAVIVFNDVIKLVSRMGKWMEHARSPGSPLVCHSKFLKKSSIQDTVAGTIVLQQWKATWRYFIPTIFLLAHGTVMVLRGTGISHTVRCLFYINSQTTSIGGIRA